MTDLNFEQKTGSFTFLTSRNVKRSLTNSMLFVFASMAALLIPSLSFAGVDENIDNFVAPVSDFLSKTVFYSVSLFKTDIKIVVALIIIAGIFFTLYFKFINIWGFRRAIALIKGEDPDPTAPGEVSHFQALSTACAATVGLGNIAGVAIAVSKGGPGATFWMIIAGFLGMSLKFCECTLGVKYRQENPDGSVSGGPMYYLSRGFEKRGMKRLGKFLAVLFSIFCIGGAIGAGCIFQANQSFRQVQIIAGQKIEIAGWFFGIIMSVIVALVIIGGIRSIARVTSRLVPFMALIYVGAAIIIIALNVDKIPSVIGLIISGAFTTEGVEGGALGVMIWGFQRAAFSNEAGLGSAPIAHSAVKTSYPATEGLVSLLEPFIDTVIICTMTSIVIILMGTYQTPQGGVSGIEITSAAFGKAIPWFPYVLGLAAFMFAFSTIISWSYYGLKSWTFLIGETKWSEISFKIIFCILVVVGSTLSLTQVINISDSLIFLMAFVNIAGMFVLFPDVKQELQYYMKKNNLPS